MMPQLSELKGTAAATKPAFVKKAERLIVSLDVWFVGLLVFWLINCLVCIAFFESKTKRTNLLKSSITKNGSINNFATTDKKKATRITALKDKNKLRNIAAKTPMINKMLNANQMKPKFLFLVTDQFLKVLMIAL